MPEPFSFGRVGVELTASTPEREGPPLSETPMRLLLLGDWAGRAGRLGPSKPGLVKWTPVPVDRDNLDEVLARFGVELRLSLGGPDDPPVTVRLAELDDFHPDRLFQRLEPFQALRQLRARLNNPATFAAAAAEMRAWAPAEAAAAGTPAKEQDVPAPSPANPEGLLGAILEETPGRLQPSGGSPGAADWQGLIQRIVEPYLLPKTDYARQAGLVALVDDAAGTLMRAVLRHPTSGPPRPPGGRSLS